MTHWYCYECRTRSGECNGPCEYIDPIGELHEPPIKCTIDDAVWTKDKFDLDKIPPRTQQHPTSPEAHR